MLLDGNAIETIIRDEIYEHEKVLGYKKLRIVLGIVWYERLKEIYERKIFNVFWGHDVKIGKFLYGFKLKE